MCEAVLDLRGTPTPIAAHVLASAESRPLPPRYTNRFRADEKAVLATRRTGATLGPHGERTFECALGEARPQGAPATGEAPPQQSIACITNS